jgi:hypothetical protein
VRGLLIKTALSDALIARDGYAGSISTDKAQSGALWPCFSLPIEPRSPQVNPLFVVGRSRGAIFQAGDFPALILPDRFHRKGVDVWISPCHPINSNRLSAKRFVPAEFFQPRHGVIHGRDH